MPFELPPVPMYREPDAETFEKLRRTRLLLMNLVREGVIHRGEYTRLMRKTMTEHFVVDGPLRASAVGSVRDVVGQILLLIDRGVFVKGVDMVDYRSCPGFAAIATSALYAAFRAEWKITDAALREALRAVQADHEDIIYGLSEKVLFRSKVDRRRALVINLANARTFADGGDPSPPDTVVEKLEAELGQRTREAPTAE